MGGRRGRNFVDVRTQPDVNLLDEVVAHVEELKKQGKHVLLAGYTAGSRDRLVTLLKEHGEYGVEEVEDWAAAQQSKISPAIILPVDHGFASPELAIITEADIFGERLARPQKKRRKAENFISEASALNAGDLVVHVDHGVGRYEGLETLLVGGAPHDCLRIVYADNDKLFVPVENINVLTRYGESDSATLDKLGGVAWQGRKAKVKKKLLEMAAALLKIAAERQLRRGRSDDAARRPV
jgi:transcription-repair coupling factor (superfamily II helicase)